jgi:hypothetical protein
MNRIWLCVICVTAIFPSSLALAAHCGQCGQQCNEQHLVKKVVLVPTVVTETRVKSRLIEATEEREEKYTVFKRVAKQQKFTKEICYLEDEVKTKTITETKCHRVTNPVERTYGVQVPVEEIHEGTATRTCCDVCGREVTVETPCSCKKTRLEKETRVQQTEVEDVVFEKVTRQIDYCVKTPKKQVETCAEETVYKLEPVEKTRKVSVCVPKFVKEPIEVQVTKMIPTAIYCCEKCSGIHH